LANPSKLKEAAEGFSMDGMKEALMNQAIDMFKVKCKELSVPVEIADILVSMINKDTEGLKVNLCLLIE
jgi:hypothetical protein